MPTAVKTWVFDSDAEGLVDEGTNANIAFGFVSSDGSPSNGCVNFITTALANGKGKAKRSSTGQTWETWGVPAGATIISVQITDWQSKVQAYPGGISNDVNARILNSSNTSVHSAGDLLSGVGGLAHIPTAWTNEAAGPSLNVDSAYEASTTDVRLELELNVGNAAASGIDDRLDTIELTITYALTTPDEDYRDAGEYLPRPLPAQHYVDLPLGAKDDSAAAPLRGMPDEDFRLLGPAPAPAAHYLQLPAGDWEKSEPPILAGQPDEDFWKNPIKPVPPENWQPPQWVLIDPQDLRVVSTTLGPDEHFWQNPVQPLAAAQYQWLPAYAFRDAGELAPGVIPLGPAVILKNAMSVQQTNLWCIARVAATKEFNLNLLTADVNLTATYVIKQVFSTPLAGVDGTTTGYTWQAEMCVPWPCIGQLQIYGATGIAYDADIRFFYKMRHRRR